MPPPRLKYTETSGAGRSLALPPRLFLAFTHEIDHYPTHTHSLNTILSISASAPSHSLQLCSSSCEPLAPPMLRTSDSSLAAPAPTLLSSHPSHPSHPPSYLARSSALRPPERSPHYLPQPPPPPDASHTSATLRRLHAPVRHRIPAHVALLHSRLRVSERDYPCSCIAKSSGHAHCLAIMLAATLSTSNRYTTLPF